MRKGLGGRVCMMLKADRTIMCGNTTARILVTAHYNMTTPAQIHGRCGTQHDTIIRHTYAGEARLRGQTYL